MKIGLRRRASTLIIISLFTVRPTIPCCLRLFRICSREPSGFEDLRASSPNSIRKFYWMITTNCYSSFARETPMVVPIPCIGTSCVDSGGWPII